MNWKDIAVRAFKTAVQTMFAVMTVDAFMAGNVPVITEAAAAGAAAGLSVLWNAVMQWANS